MKRIEGFCDSCDSEFSVELIDSESIAKHCPVCGEKLDQSEMMILDEDFLEEDWED
jgi:uncharacterized paraquat-inducible protein A